MRSFPIKAPAYRQPLPILQFKTIREQGGHRREIDQQMIIAFGEIRRRQRRRNLRIRRIDHQFIACQQMDNAAAASTDPAISLDIYIGDLRPWHLQITAIELHRKRSQQF